MMLTFGNYERIKRNEKKRLAFIEKVDSSKNADTIYLKIFRKWVKKFIKENNNE